MARFNLFRVALLSSIAVVVAIGCGGGDRRESVGHVEQAAVVCAKGPVVLGIDVSEWQGSINWSAVKAAGREYAIARISDGSYHDKYFGANWPAMKSAGLVRGAYQFFEPGEDPGMQADIVIAAVGHLGDGDLPVVADMEATGGQSAATIVAHLHTWVDKVTAGTGKKPFIYTGKYFWQDNVGDSADFSSLPLWIAAYGPTCPDLPGAWGDWKFFQYTDKDSVGGVGGGVDGDKFNGTLADLHAFAGGGADYAAQFVSQTWPFASTALKVTPGQVVDAKLVMRNVGKKGWDGNTFLGTSEPRDRPSGFAGSDWPSSHRAAHLGGAVAPGGEGTFSFTLHAPYTPGDYHEHFGIVQEGVAWFSDPGQGGPADNVIEAWISVVPAKYAAEFVSQSFPTSDKTLTMKVGDVVDGYIELKNVGTDPWKAGETKLAPTPRDKPSVLGGATWLSPTRVSSPTADVPPGGTYKFPVTLNANQIGDHLQTFGVVEEAVTWFSDPANGGGPPDDFLKVHVVVTDSSGDSGPKAPNPTDDGGVVGVDGGSADGGDPVNDLSSTDSSGGCTYGEGGNRGLPNSAMLTMLIGVAALVVRRRLTH